MKNILDLHSHTIASGHAYNTIYEMAKSASDKGLELFGITDHGPKLPGACHPFHFINLKVIPRELFGVKLILGCEMNIMDYQGNLDLEARFCQHLDYGIAGIHLPCYESGTTAQNTDAYVNAMKNPYVHIISHPDDGRFPIDYETLVCAAKEEQVLLEVNASSLHPQCNRTNARENYCTMLEYCSKHRVSIIMDSDAHCEVDVGNLVRAQALLTELNFPEELIVNSSISKVAEFIPCLRQTIYTGGSRKND